MNELIMPHNVGVKNVLDSMKEVKSFFIFQDSVTSVVQ